MEAEEGATERSVAQLEKQNAALTTKLERWESQSKKVIEQHRDRIKELSQKLKVSLKQSDAQSKLLAAAFEFCNAQSGLEREYMVAHEDILMEQVDALTRSIASSNYQSAAATLEKKLGSAAKDITDLKDRLQLKERELAQLQESSRSLQESMEATRDNDRISQDVGLKAAVSEAVKASKESFEAEKLSIQIRFETELSNEKAMHLAHVDRLMKEMEQTIERVQSTAALRSVHEVPTDALQDDSYQLLLDTNNTLEQELSELRDENGRLNEALLQFKSTSNAPSTRFHGTPSAAPSQMPRSLAEAATMLMELEGRERRLQDELTNVTVQLGALQENPPTPAGGLNAEQTKYLKSVIEKLYGSSSNCQQLMKQLAPVFVQLLGIAGSVG